MKIYHVKDVKRFADFINHCEGDVTLVSKDGNRDLKKELATLKEMNERFGESEINDIEVIASNPADTVRLIHYLMCA